MNDINISVENTKLFGDEILALVNDYCKVIDKIKREVDNIQESNLWNGIDSSKFVEGSNDYMNSFKNIKEVLKFYGAFIKQASSIYQALENDYSEKEIINCE